MSKLEDVIVYWEKYYENRTKLMNETKDINLKTDVRKKLHLVQGFIDDLKYANGDDNPHDKALHKHIVSVNEVAVCVHPFKFVVIHGSKCHCLKCGCDIDTQTER